MRKYPQMPSGMSYGMPIYAFDKIDGSNVRAEWRKDEEGFCSYGARRHPLKSDSDLIESVSLMEEFEEDLSEIFLNQGYEKVTCFFEFFGPNSLAGIHTEKDYGNFEVTLFDVWPDDQGITEPDLFLERYGHLKTPDLLFEGIPGNDFYDSVLDGSLEGMSGQGVVCKGFDQGEENPTMYKVKSKKWLERVKDFADKNDLSYRDLI